ncbi:MAG: caspase family protein [Leptolyngbya sp. IPPAS B-1204]|nr:MAG: DUF4384 domain-containing protein [Leptolyngbya sp. IPPAS B-1204]
MAVKRRTFLQQAGVALAALGLSEAGLVWADRCQQVLAQPARRKVALLVGINQYPESVCDYTPVRGAALNGCVTDVELQQELLIHRFGFQPSDILTLTDQAATRQGIEESLLLLSQQVTAGDVVLFHFSGLGSQVQLEGGADFQQSLVPVDGLLPTADHPVIQDLMLDTLGLLLRIVPTDQLITVLDTAYTRLGRTLQGNLRIRSRPDAPTGMLTAAEQELQERLSRQTHFSLAQINQQWRSGLLPGIVLQAAAANRIATEAQWNGFSAGLFTYALTQQLWWASPATTLWISFSQAMGTVKQTAGIEQQPAIGGQAAQKQKLPVVSSFNPAGADGVIRALDDDGRAQLWLAGLPAGVVENVGASLFSLAGTDNTPLLQIRSHEGLIAKARTWDGKTPLQVGQLVQEAVRILPRNIGLTVAIDTGLERIERVDATSAFASIPRVSSVLAGEQPADFLFGKIQSGPLLAAALSSQALLANDDTPNLDEETNPSSQSSYGLFYPGRGAIFNTLNQGAEAVKTAVNRITPQLKTLLAIKLLRLTQNQGSSRLGVRASLEILAPQERLILQQETVRAQRTMPTTKVATLLMAEGTPTLAVGSQIQYRLYNYSEHPVYFLLLGLDTKGNALIFYPNLAPTAAAAINPLAPSEAVTVPQAHAANWLVQPPSGVAETHLVCSRAPFTQTYQVLADMPGKVPAQEVAVLLNPLDVVQAILHDLHQASSELLPISDVPSDVYALDVNAWATLSFVYQVSGLAQELGEAKRGFA